MPNIDLSILNQRQTPAFYADTLANRPAAGFVGRIFVSTNTFAFYRDNGTGWDLIGGPGTGTITGSGTSGQIALWDGASTITGDTGLTYNGTDNSLTASKFIVTGGTSSQFLKADGSVDSSSYVPYTGATASLNMGANNISGQNYFINGNGTNSGGFLGIKQYSGSSSGTNGYTSISALTQNSLYFQFSQTNGSNKTFELSTGLLGTTIRQYQLPDADGTIALTSNIPSVSGAAGQVSYFNGTNSITGSNDLFWDSVNGHLGVNTNIPGTALDVHHDQPTVAILNQTVATNDVRIGFQNNGVGLWRIGAFYNAGANDFGIYDAVAALQPVTVKKTTGQVLIGTSTVGSGKLVVASNIGDNGVQIVGASAPSLRIDNAESGPTKRAGLGISTATNNFIQGSADRDFCMFNGSTTASPILFGIYDTTNVQEAARISAARNFLIGTTTDAGQKLQVNGTTLTNNLIQTNLAGGLAYRAYFGSGNNRSLDINIDQSNGDSQLTWNTTYNAGWKYFVNNYASRISTGDGLIFGVAPAGTAGNTINWINALTINSTGAATFSNSISCLDITAKDVINIIDSGTNTKYLQLTTTNTIANIATNYTNTNIPLSLNSYGNNNQLYLNTTGNVLIGTSTDAGDKLQVNGAMKTASPSGGTAGSWKLGTATSGAAIQGGTVRIEINGVAYDLLTT